MDGEVSPRPRNKRLTASKEPPKHNAVGNVLLQSWKKKKTQRTMETYPLYVMLQKIIIS